MKLRLCLLILALLVMLGGCAGGSEDSRNLGGAPLSDFDALMPDGSLMVLDVVTNDGRNWSGGYAVTAETGEHAFEAGSFEGTIEGGHISAVCEDLTGKEFRLEGTADAPDHFSLTRSDIPNFTLEFHEVAPAAPARSDWTFMLTTGEQARRVTVSSTPYMTYSTMTHYRGFRDGMQVSLMVYSTRTIVYIYPLSVAGACAVYPFLDYLPADFPTKTAASNGMIEIRNVTLQKTFSASSTATASP